LELPRETKDAEAAQAIAAREPEFKFVKENEQGIDRSGMASKVALRYVASL